MKTSTLTLEKGKLMPNLVIKDTAGQKHALWDFRQKSHVVLICDPESKKETVKHWLTAIAADQKQWDWLNVKIVIAAKAIPGLLPGVYAIDRYGMFLTSFPTDHWGFDDIEREFLYYEARHC